MEEKALEQCLVYVKHGVSCHYHESEAVTHSADPCGTGGQGESGFLQTIAKSSSEEGSAGYFGVSQGRGGEEPNRNTKVAFSKYTR